MQKEKKNAHCPLIGHVDVRERLYILFATGRTKNILLLKHLSTSATLSMLAT
jgi:hypothetical protein